MKKNDSNVMRQGFHFPRTALLKGIFISFLFFSALTAKAVDFAGGTGTAADPYLIATRAQLETLNDYIGADNAGFHFRLVADIDLAGSDWTPISSASATAFQGKLHGGGHQIQNISLSNSNQLNGLFGCLANGAYVDSLQIVGGDIATTRTSGDTRIGAIAGFINSTTDGVVVYGCSNSANIHSATSNYVGGIVGYINASSAGTYSVTIESCVNTGNVTTGGTNVGGIVGYAYINNVVKSISILNSYSNASISHTAASGTVYAGGVIGYIQWGAAAAVLIDKCYAAGSVTATSSAVRLGGIVGRSAGNNEMTISNSFALQNSLNGTSSYLAHI
jgi:hypothetical protein